jgi:hypothetical protein
MLKHREWASHSTRGVLVLSACVGRACGHGSQRRIRLPILDTRRFWFLSNKLSEASKATPVESVLVPVSIIEEPSLNRKNKINSSPCIRLFWSSTALNVMSSVTPPIVIVPLSGTYWDAGAAGDTSGELASPSRIEVRRPCFIFTEMERGVLGAEPTTDGIIPEYVPSSGGSCDATNSPEGVGHSRFPMLEVLKLPAHSVEPCAGTLPLIDKDGNVLSSARAPTGL